MNPSSELRLSAQFPSRVDAATLPEPLAKIVRHGARTPLHLSGETRFSLLNARDTGGALALSRADFRAGSGSPLHWHSREDEFFWVERGEFEFRLDEKIERLQSGDFVFGPRFVPHAYTCCSDDGTLWIGLVRAGFEQFFHDIAAHIATNSVPLDKSALQVLAADYGVHLAPFSAENRPPEFVMSQAQTLIVRAGETSETAEIHGRVAHNLRVLLTSHRAGGRLCVLDARDAPLRASQTQTHSNFDVVFIIQAGRYEFCLDDARVQGAAGDVVWVPCGTPYSFRVVSPQAGRALMISTPGGLDDALANNSRQHAWPFTDEI